MRSTESKKIGNSTFEVALLTPMEAHKLLTRVLKNLAPTLGAVAVSFESLAALAKDVKATILLTATGLADDKVKENLSGLERIITEIGTSLDEELLNEVIEKLTKVTFISTAKGKAALSEVFEAQFAGNLSEMYQWLWFAWTVQYKDFFDLVKKRVPT